MSLRAVIIQTNYVPWKGYFDLLSRADVVVYFDSVQSTKNDWRNRNRIKTHGGVGWLTIPIRHSNQLRIRDVTIGSNNWHEKHLRTIAQSYARAPYARDLLPAISGWYDGAAPLTRLSAVNRLFLDRVCEQLGISPTFIDVETVLADHEHDALDPTARLVEICRRLGASAYLSGPAASDYLDQSRFAEAGIELEWFNYEGYAEYPQLHGEFRHDVSILDLLLMTGPQARTYALRGPIDR
jgi:hypothetical protein